MVGVVWVVLVVSIAAGGWLAVVRRQQMRLVAADRHFEKGRCMACGYDVSGSPAARCPECGDDLMAQVCRYYGPRLDKK